jgi:hypothetical protein
MTPKTLWSLILALLFSSILAYAQSPSSGPIYLDPAQPLEQRVNDLLSRMTLKEKVGQLNLPAVYVDGLGKTNPEKMEACKGLVAGTYNRGIGPGSGFFSLADTILHVGARQQAEFFNALQKADDGFPNPERACKRARVGRHRDVRTIPTSPRSPTGSVTAGQTRKAMRICRARLFTPLDMD